MSNIATITSVVGDREDQIRVNVVGICSGIIAAGSRGKVRRKVEYITAGLHRSTHCCALSYTVTPQIQQSSSNIQFPT